MLGDEFDKWVRVEDEIVVLKGQVRISRDEEERRAELEKARDRLLEEVDKEREEERREDWLMKLEELDKKTKGAVWIGGDERITRDEMFGQIVEIVALRSTCKRSKVGALIVKDGRIISIGYNGVPAGVPHCGECLGAGCDISVHAEMNAIAFAAKEGLRINGSTLYCSLSPCINCAKVILNSGIERVVYEREYRKSDGRELLERRGIKIERREKGSVTCEDTLL